MKAIQFSLIMIAATLAAGCAPTTKYAWGGYETSLYDHYRTPGNNAAFAESLSQTIAKAEVSGQRVPPGIYAEYGSVLLDMGDNTLASASFEKEKQHWPESTTLMDTMLRLAFKPQEQKP